MRAKTLLTLCCFLTLLLAGTALFAAPAPAQLLHEITAPPVCSAEPATQNPQPALGLAGGSAAVQSSACPVAVWQACYQRYGTCTLCFCLGSACECENRCV